MPLLMELPPPAFPARGSSSSLLLVVFFCREVRAALGMGLFGFLPGVWRDLCAQPVPLRLLSPPCHFWAPWLGLEGVK